MKETPQQCGLRQTAGHNRLMFDEKMGHEEIRKKTYNNFSWVVLRRISDCSIINDKCVSSQSIVVCPAMALGEFALRVRQEKNIVSPNVIGLSPGSHHVGIVEGYHSNDIHAFSFQCTDILDVSREVFFGAAGSESTFQIIC